jgi:hypothetical protein
MENEKIVYRTSPIHGINLIITCTLKPIQTRTEVSYATDYEMPWGVFGKFLDKVMMKRPMEKDLEKELKGLKSVLEK